MPTNFILTLSCADRPGIVAAVTTELAALNANIAESNQFWDRETGQFFMRLAFAAPDGIDRGALERTLKPAIARFGMRTALTDQGARKKIVVMVSKFDHALLHLLYQIRVGWLDADVAAIVSNHENSRATADYEGIPYHCCPSARTQGGTGGAGAGAGQGQRRRARGARALHADPERQLRDQAVRSDHQHPPLVPAQLQGRQALSPGARARRQDHRRHGTLRDARVSTRARSSSRRRRA